MQQSPRCCNSSGTCHPRRNDTKTESRNSQLNCNSGDRCCARLFPRSSRDAQNATPSEPHVLTASWTTRTAPHPKSRSNPNTLPATNGPAGAPGGTAGRNWKGPWQRPAQSLAVGGFRSMTARIADWRACHVLSLTAKAKIKTIGTEGSTMQLEQTLVGSQRQPRMCHQAIMNRSGPGPSEQPSCRVCKSPQMTHDNPNSLRDPLGDHDDSWTR